MSLKTYTRRHRFYTRSAATRETCFRRICDANIKISWMNFLNLHLELSWQYQGNWYSTTTVLHILNDASVTNLLHFDAIKCELFAAFVFERKILRRMFGPTKENQIWKIKTKEQLDKLIKHKNIVNYIVNVVNYVVNIVNYIVIYVVNYIASIVNYIVSKTNYIVNIVNYIVKYIVNYIANKISKINYIVNIVD